MTTAPSGAPVTTTSTTYTKVVNRDGSVTITTTRITTTSQSVTYAKANEVPAALQAHMGGW
ncbi:hypothetical protein ACIA8R_29720 [Nonomuraea sp. NPDC051191]|uniref:hypothetical protein n=1 Tax=Nonomuraea sp. NPDC051191 TaxID=3364372 RepID=UPI0037A1643F